MRILSWVQNKLNGKQETKRFDPVSTSDHYDKKEEFSDWPQALLAIGTFGNNEFKENQQRYQSSEEELKEEEEDPETPEPPKNSQPSHDLPDFTLEELSKLQSELTKLLTLKPKTSTDGSGERPNLPLNRFLNCPSSLEVDRISCHKLPDDPENNEVGDLSPKSKIILNKAKDILSDNCSGIRQRSIKFLLKKMFAWRNGFLSVPNIRDSIPESRMEKLLRMIIHKKICPQSSTPNLVKEYLEKKPLDKRNKEDRLDGKEEEGCKWVKTDSEFIVLEM